MQVSFLCYIFLHNTLHTTTVKQHYACLPLPEFPTLSVPIEVENRRGKCMKPANPLLCPLPLDPFSLLQDVMLIHSKRTKIKPLFDILFSPTKMLAVSGSTFLTFMKTTVCELKESNLPPPLQLKYYFIYNYVDHLTDQSSDIFFTIKLL